ncbi:MAG: HEPN domain-containing protein [Candidatus Manganitrophus sp.]|nr:MAG: HEPN domain-containing protein [Candidatus Manganitrophus sp.]
METTLARAPHTTADIEVQSDFAKYFCVLVSGFLENALIEIVLDFAQKRSAPEVALFVERQLDYWTNPNCEKIANLIGSFSPDWRVKVEGYLIDERKAAVNSLVALRHKIAHGESVGTSLSQVKEYYSKVVEVVNFVADLADPP